MKNNFTTVTVRSKLLVHSRIEQHNDEASRKTGVLLDHSEVTIWKQELIPHYGNLDTFNLVCIW